MKKLNSIFILLILFMNYSLLFSQEKRGQTLTSEVTESPVTDPRIAEVVRNLKTAKKSGDVIAKDYWVDRLNDLTHPQIVQENSGSLIFKKENREISGTEKTFNFTRISNSVLGSVSISRENINGTIYAACGIYGGASADTLTILKSTNNGISFTVVASVSTGGVFKISYNSIDVEAVNDGTSSYAFITMSYTLGTGITSFVARVKQDGTLLSSIQLFGSTSVSYINPKITSDNANYSTNSFIYFSVTVDSNISGSRYLKSKLYSIRNPFSPTMTLTSGYQGSSGGAYAYYTSSPVPDSANFQTDIAYVNTVNDSDQIYSVSVIRGVPAFSGAGLYLSRSNDYGATAPTTFSTNDAPYLKENPRIASTGYKNNSIMIITRRLFAGGDWDPYFFYSANANWSVPVYSTGYVNTASDTTIGVSVAGKQRSNGSYLFAYNNRGSGTYSVYSRLFIGTLGVNVQLNPPGVTGTSIYGFPDAAFRNVNNDSCLVAWGGALGLGAYVTGGCSGTFTGVGNPSSELRDFRVDQNYPNPFNPTTNISYNIPVSGLVKIVVYDVLGSEVATVLNENKTAGYYSTTFDGKNLASGAYYYKITFISEDSKSFSQTKKMLLVK
ncbi:hypothetical protein BH10BAC5_BH10BAC5_07210 [soil metagenome]